MKKFLVAAAAFACAGNTLAQSDLSYDFAQLSFVTESLDDYDCTQNGLAIAGNVTVSGDVFLTGGLTDVSGDSCGSTTFSGGAGFKIDLLQDVSVYSSLSLASTQVDVGEGDTGMVFALGGRALVTNNLEAKIQLSHATAFDGATGLGGGFNYWFDPRFSALAEFNFSSESRSFAFGVRMDF